MLNWADYALIGIISFSALMSLIRGFVREALSLLSWIVAIWVGINYSSQMAAILAPYIKSVPFRVPAGFAVLFLAVLIMGGMINFIISTLVDKTGLSGTDRAIGMVFGLARGVLVVGVLLLLAQITPAPQSPWWKQSLMIPHFQPLEDWLHTFIPKSVSNRFELSTKD